MVPLFIYFSSFLCLCCTCRILRGKGQVVDGDKGVIYTHTDLVAWVYGFVTAQGRWCIWASSLVEGWHCTIICFFSFRNVMLGNCFESYENIMFFLNKLWKFSVGLRKIATNFTLQISWLKEKSIIRLQIVLFLSCSLPIIPVLNYF